ncbi:MAG: transcription antitermination factor NusB [Eubacterium sp.]|nr:transcription antitermination factor NusB [Eubacterium sp.]MCI6996487.1 transcription antitermination factor NusB [Eubacterium sp.]MDY2596298.1 transcription antitermination factor NusB [Oliverpabstia sp.]
MGRREQRESIFHLLFMTEFNPSEEIPEQKQMYLDNIEELQEKDQSYIQNKFENIREKITEMDDILNQCSKGWKTSRMGKVDLSILRLAVYEILFDEEVPDKVAINEAVELAKKFGGDESPSFINGVLGKVAAMKQ